MAHINGAGIVNSGGAAIAGEPGTNNFMWQDFEQFETGALPPIRSLITLWCLDCGFSRDCWYGM